MKKTMLMLAAAAVMFAAPACKKEETPKAAITQTITQSLRTGETYTFTLPKNLRDDEYEITTQAQHATVSEVGRNTSGDQVYTYTPEAGYSGSDQVVVSNDWERDSMCVHPQGPPPPPGTHHHKKCDKQDEDHYIITMNFVMKGSESVPASN